MYKTNKQIAKEIKEYRKKKIRQVVARNYSKSAKRKKRLEQEYKESVENFYIALPNV